jgi:hypothetical protein
VGGDINVARITGIAVLLDTYREVVTQGQGSVSMFIRKTGPLFAACEIIIRLMSDYQHNVRFLCIITVHPKKVLQCLCFTYCTKLRHRRNTVQRLRMFRSENCRNKVRQAMKERSQD